MAQYGEHVPYNGQYVQQYQHPPQQYTQPQYYSQGQPQEHGHYSQDSQQPAGYQYSQSYQHQHQQQPQPSHPYPQEYPQPYAQQYPQHSQQYPQQYPHQYPQQNPYVNGYGYSQGPAPTNTYPPQYQGVNSNPHPAPNQAQPHSCYNCGRPDHFAQNCPEPRRDTATGGFKRNYRFPGHQPQKNPALPTNTGLSRTSSFTAQSPHYGQSPQAQSPHSNTPQTSYASGPPQWQGSPPQQSLQTQNHEAHWQNHQISLNASQAPQPNLGQHHSSSSPATPFSGPQFNPPTQSWPFQIPSRLGSANNITPETSTHAPETTNPNFKTNDLNEDLAVSDPDPEDLEDDLSKLDVPDIPQISSLYDNGVVKLVSQVLPSNFVVADALYPLATPPPEADGKCQSRFFHNKSEEDSLQDFRASPLWRDRQEDTIFCLVEENGPIINIKECLNRVKERRQPRLEENLRQIRKHSQSNQVRSAEAMEMADALAKVEKALADAKAKEAEMLARKRKAKAHQGRPNGHSENETKNMASPASERQTQLVRKSSETEMIAQDHLRDSRRMTERSDERIPPTARPPPNKRMTNASHHTNGPRLPNEGNINSGKEPGQIPNSAPRNKSQQSEMISPSILHHGSPDLDRRSSLERRSSQSHNMDRAPLPNSHDTNFNRKRNYESRAESSSDEDDDSPRRQENDVTPKHKKRQPKVAAAYSRRW